jgi:hypothetical protein
MRSRSTAVIDLTCLNTHHRRRRKMRNLHPVIIGAVFLSLIGACTPALAIDPRTETALQHLDPETRLTEVCNLAALDKMDRDRGPFHPEHVAVDQFSLPKRTGDTLQGSGGVFRSKGDWYHLSFKCTASSDHMKVITFSYKVGEKVPRNQWTSLNLYP